MLNQLKNDIKRMILLSIEIGKMENEYMNCSNLNDKYNYNYEKQCILNSKLSEYHTELSQLKEKWLS